MCVHYNNFEYEIAECLECSHIFVANIPDEQTLKDMYNGYDYFIKDRGHQGISELQNDEGWRQFTEHRLESLRMFNLITDNMINRLDILELGCLEGKVLHVLNRMGHRVHGCEINKEVAFLGAESFGIDIRGGTLSECEFEQGSLDVIYAFHVFEHLTNPLEELALCHRLLKPGGHILIEVPSGETDYENPQHLQFYNEKSIKGLFNKIFGDVTIIPDYYHLIDKSHSQTAICCACKVN